MLGEDVEFELEWVSIYTFQCRRMDRSARPGDLCRRRRAPGLAVRRARRQFRLAGHRQSGWKLKLVLEGKAPESLLDSYDAPSASTARTRTS
jgi:3-(3-hydroxy-phenyl)propionate hydroxylase